MARGKEKHIFWPFTSNRAPTRFVEFETGADLKTAVDNLDGKQFKEATVHCVQDVSALGVVCLQMCWRSSYFRSKKVLLQTRAIAKEVHRAAAGDLQAMTNMVVVRHAGTALERTTESGLRADVPMTIMADQNMGDVHHLQGETTDHHRRGGIPTTMQITGTDRQDHLGDMMMGMQGMVRLIVADQEPRQEEATGVMVDTLTKTEDFEGGATKNPELQHWQRWGL
jgi:hypothetical protein